MERDFSRRSAMMGNVRIWRVHLLLLFVVLVSFSCSGETLTLTVTLGGSGRGTITSNSKAINCGEICRSSFDTGTAVMLIANPASDSTFEGWGDDCTGDEPSTSITLDADKRCTATFTLLSPSQSTLMITKAGSGEGVVISNPSGIDCGPTCQGNFNNGTVISLTAVASADSTFIGWSGNCGGTETSVSITLTEEVNCTAAFDIAAPNLFRLNIIKLGSGVVTTDQGEIDCGTTCQATLLEGVSITLRAAPTSDAVFAGWSGDCTGEGSILSITSTADLTCTANFTGLFGAAVHFDVGNFPVHVQIGDLNGDGKPDLVTSNEFGHSVSVLLGRGDGSFGPAAEFPVGVGPCSVVIGDFNGDEIPDLATADAGTATPADTVSVLFGDGTGSFSTATTYTVGSSPRGIVAGDLNRDGTLDLAIASWGTNTASILIGNGDGTFMPVTEYAAGANPRAIAIGDLDGDGSLDLAIANRNSASFSVLLGDGHGIFSSPTDYAAGSFPRSIAVGDLNGDGKADVVVVNNNSDDLSLFLGEGAGLFGTAVHFPVGDAPRGVVIGDLNEDGRPDLAVANSGGSPSILLGDGAGVFGPGIDFAAETTPSAVVLGDLNGDGKPDLAVTNAGSDTLSVFLHQ
jgi:hypothetical protein